MLKAAYDAWWCKWDTFGLMKIWLEKFSAPSIIATMHEGAAKDCEKDAEGNVISCVEPEDGYLDNLMGYIAGSALVLPFGATFQVVQAAGDPNGYCAIITKMDKAMRRVITGQEVAGADSEHQSRASGSIGQDIFSLRVRCIRQKLSEAFENDLFRMLIQRLVDYHGYPKRAMQLVPNYDLGDDSGFAITAADVSSLQSYLHPSQYVAIDKMLGLPPRVIDEAQVSQQGIIIPEGFATLLQSGFLSPSQIGSLDQALGLPPRSEADLRRLIDAEDAELDALEAESDNDGDREGD